MPPSRVESELRERAEESAFATGSICCSEELWRGKHRLRLGFVAIRVGNTEGRIPEPCDTSTSPREEVDGVLRFRWEFVGDRLADHEESDDPKPPTGKG